MSENTPRQLGPGEAPSPPPRTPEELRERIRFGAINWSRAETHLLDAELNQDVNPNYPDPLHFDSKTNPRNLVEVAQDPIERGKYAAAHPSEDACEVNPDAGVFVLADGMRGHGGGRLAAQAASRGFAHSIGASRPHLDHAVSTGNEAEVRRLLQQAILGAEQNVAAAKADAEQNGSPVPDARTTLVAAVTLGPGSVAMVNIGNTAGYVKREDGYVERVTQDQSDPSNPKRPTNAVDGHKRIGPRPVSDPSVLASDQIEIVPVGPNDQILLCSKGVDGAYPEEKIPPVVLGNVMHSAAEPAEAAREMATLPERLKRGNPDWRTASGDPYKPSKEDRSAIVIDFQGQPRKKTEATAPEDASRIEAASRRRQLAMALSAVGLTGVIKGGVPMERHEAVRTPRDVWSLRALELIAKENESGGELSEKDQIELEYVIATLNREVDENGNVMGAARIDQTPGGKNVDNIPERVRTDRRYRLGPDKIKRYQWPTERRVPKRGQYLPPAAAAPFKAVDWEFRDGKFTPVSFERPENGKLPWTGNYLLEMFSIHSPEAQDAGTVLDRDGLELVKLMHAVYMKPQKGTEYGFRMAKIRERLNQRRVPPAWELERAGPGMDAYTTHPVPHEDYAKIGFDDFLLQQFGGEHIKSATFKRPVLRGKVALRGGVITVGRAVGRAGSAVVSRLRR